MEGDPTQSTPAAETADGGTAASPASAPAASSSGGPASWEAAFAEPDEAGASNRGSSPTTDPVAPAEAAASAAPDDTKSKDAASNAVDAPAGGGTDGPPKPDAEGDKPTGQREPQPGSRRSTAAELDAQREENAALRQQFEQWAAEKAERDKAETERQESEAKAKAEAEAAVEGILGKPGEMAGLLSKLARTKTDPTTTWTVADEDRLIELTRGAELYGPLLERATREAEAKHAARIQDAEGRLNGLLSGLSKKVLQAAELEGVDPEALNNPDLHEIHRHIHAVAFKAGAASRDGEFADLQGQLADARGKAFVSQPHLATGGVSGNGRTTAGYDPNKTPASNLESAFAEDAPALANGRR